MIRIILAVKLPMKSSSALVCVYAVLLVGGALIDTSAASEMANRKRNVGKERKKNIQVTPLIATNSDCQGAKKECEWREISPQEMGTGLILGQNVENTPGTTHAFTMSCIVCDSSKLCSSPDDKKSHFTQTLRNQRNPSLLSHHVRIGKLVQKIVDKCKVANPLKTLTLKQIRRDHAGLAGLMAMPDALIGLDGASGMISGPQAELSEQAENLAGANATVSSMLRKN